jgi:hypothetical protein
MADDDILPLVRPFYLLDNSYHSYSCRRVMAFVGEADRPRSERMSREKVLFLISCNLLVRVSWHHERGRYSIFCPDCTTRGGLTLSALLRSHHIPLECLEKRNMYCVPRYSEAIVSPPVPQVLPDAIDAHVDPTRLMRSDNPFDEARRKLTDPHGVLGRDANLMFLRNDITMEPNAMARALMLPLFFGARPRRGVPRAVSKHAAQLIVDIKLSPLRGPAEMVKMTEKVAKTILFIPPLRLWYTHMASSPGVFVRTVRGIVEKAREMQCDSGETQHLLTTQYSLAHMVLEQETPVPVGDQNPEFLAVIRRLGIENPLKARAVRTYISMVEGTEKRMLSLVAGRIERLHHERGSAFPLEAAYDRMFAGLAAIYTAPDDAQPAMIMSTDFLARFACMMCVFDGMDCEWQFGPTQDNHNTTVEHLDMLMDQS